ncbi:hypothetical protein FXB39_20160 [Nocardioides sp. BGMRC 2183]|nr:hypothetical protein FXB39_20160 [Nocardioides sp. BGMRC 2183]
MTESHEAGLTRLLERATDLLEPGEGGATAALARARVRRRRTRGLTVAAAAVTVALVAVGAQVVSDHRGTDPAQPAGPTPTITTPTGPTSEDDEAVGPRWDPFTVVDEPVADSVLPAQVAPPAQAPAVADDPMEAAVLAWPREGSDLLLLGTDGRWRSVPGTAEAVNGTLDDVVRPRLSDDGRRVAMSVEDGVLIVDLTTGDEQLLPWTGVLADPQDLLPSLEWAPDGSELAVLHWRGTWFLALDGSLRRAGFGGSYGTGFSYDSDGSVLMRQWRQQAIVRYREGREVGRAPFDLWGSTRAVARGGRIAFAGGGSDLPGDGGPVVVDAETGDVIAYRPIRDRNSVYTDNGHLQPVGFWDPDTVVLLVAPMDFRTMDPGEETWHLVAWDLEDDSFMQLTQGDAGMAGVSVAVDALDVHS